MNELGSQGVALQPKFLQHPASLHTQTVWSI